jgi:DNA-binding MarR family transcriptional regulator/ribosomal protein S18 acetylase RimI-like enzyme
MNAIETVRRFNRMYTRRIGVLAHDYLDSPFSLTEARVLFELAHREEATAGAIGKDLGLDAGYLSRLFKDLQARGLVERRPNPADGRQALLSLTPAGQEAFRQLDEGSRRQIGAMLEALAPEDRTDMVAAMERIERMLGEAPAPTIVLRPHQPGDVGWVIARHGELYAREYAWDEQFEALVAEIGAQFLRAFQPKRERCWIAEVDGVRVGSVFLVDGGEGVAKLRLLLVEPSARGLGIGKRLVGECIRFARLAGYKRLTLWTNDVLVAARGIYERAGFRLVAEEAHHSFGHDLVGQTWDLDLRGDRQASVGVDSDQATHLKEEPSQ